MSFHGISPGISYRLPKVACSTSPRIHPEYPVIYEHNAAWVCKFLTFPSEAAMLRMLECCYPMWDSMVYPAGMGERVLHSSCVTSLMFEVDDVALLEWALFEGITSAWVADHPYGPAFADIFGTLERSMPEGVFRRYRKSWQDWFTHVLRENKLREAHTIPDMETYLSIRRVSVGLLPYVICAEYALEMDLTHLLAADPDLARLGRIAVEHAMFVNDLFSFRWESFKGDYFNAVSTLVHVEGHSLQATVDILCDKIREADEAMVELSSALRRRYTDPSLRAYIDALNAFCAGNLRWSRMTARYNGSGNVWNGLGSGVVTLHHERTSIAPG